MQALVGNKNGAGLTLSHGCCGHTCHLPCSVATPAACVQDLGRAQVDLSEAVFIMCDKSPADAQQEDLRNIMRCIAMGSCIQVRLSLHHDE